MMKKIKLYSAVILILLVLIVILQNTEPVATRLLFVTLTMPRAALLALTFLVGAATGVFLTLSLVKRSPKNK